MADIHKFIVKGNYFVIDVNSGSVHSVDELVYDLLDEDGLQKKTSLRKNIKISIILMKLMKHMKKSAVS